MPALYRMVQFLVDILSLYREGLGGAISRACVNSISVGLIWHGQVLQEHLRRFLGILIGDVRCVVMGSLSGITSALLDLHFNT